MTRAIEERGPVTVTPSEEERASLKQIGALFERDDADEQVIRFLGPNREEIPIPTSMVRALHEMAHALAQDHAVAVIPLHKLLTTQQAADILNVSRQYLVRLLDEGRIASSKTGTHRRIRFDDLLVFKQQRDAARRHELDLLADLSQEIEPLLD